MRYVECIIPCLVAAVCSKYDSPGCTSDGTSCTAVVRPGCGNSSRPICVAAHKRVIGEICNYRQCLVVLTCYRCYGSDCNIAAVIRYVECIIPCLVAAVCSKYDSP